MDSLIQSLTIERVGLSEWVWRNCAINCISVAVFRGVFVVIRGVWIVVLA